MNCQMHFFLFLSVQAVILNTPQWRHECNWVPASYDHVIGLHSCVFLTFDFSNLTADPKTHFPPHIVTIFEYAADSMLGQLPS